MGYHVMHRRSHRHHLSAGFVGIVVAGAAAAIFLTFTTGSGAQTRPAAAFRTPRTTAQVSELRDLAGLRQATETAMTVAVMPSHYDARPGDTLSTIARKVYGKAADWPAIWWPNRSAVPHPNLLAAGTRLKLKPTGHASQRVKRLAAKAAAPPKPRPAPPVSAQPGPAPAPAPNPGGGSLQSIAAAIFGGQVSCADAVISIESGWNVYATNPSSGAYGLPQALPGSKMASAGSDWQSNPTTQLRWMLGYVNSTYGGACGALAHEHAFGWY